MGRHYCHLKLDERRKLAKWLEAKLTIDFDIYDSSDE